MSEHCLLGIDIGTTSSKGVLVSLRGRVLAECSMEHGVDRPRPGWAEHDAERVWWGDFVHICRTLLFKAQVQPHRIVSVGCSALCPDVLPVDPHGHPLRPGILYGDTRATEEIALLEQALGQEYSLTVCGNSLSSQSVGPKVFWLRRHEPEVYQRSAKFLTASSYIVFRLTGEYTVDHNSASLGGLPYSVAAQDWDASACAECGIRLEQLPRLVWANAIVGQVTPQAASETGLLVGTPVAAGTGDFDAEAQSVGAYREGQAVISYGTTVSLAVCTQAPVAHPQLMLTRTLPGRFIIGGGLAAGSSLTKWFRDNFGQVELDVEHSLGIDAYHLLSDEANEVPPGSEGLIVLPYFSGERSPFYDPEARGLIIGLTLRHTRKHVYRALLEGVAYGIRHLQETMQDLNLPVRELIAIGGGTRSHVWTQIMSDVTQREQRIMRRALGAPLGAAFLAGLAVGAVNDIEAINGWNEIDRTVTPDQNSQSVREILSRYSVSCEHTSEDMHALSQLSMESET